MDKDQKAEEAFESRAWKEAVSAFKNSKAHKPNNYEQFLKDYSTAEEAQKTVAYEKKRCGSKYSNKMGKLYEKIDTFLQMGDLIVKAAPESIGLAWTGIRLCLNVTKDDYDTFQLFTGTCADIVGMMISCRIYGKLYSDKRRPPDFEDLHNKVIYLIGRTYQNILEFSYQMWKYSKQNAATSIAKGLLCSKKIELQPLIDTITKDESQMSQYAGQASQQSLQYYQQQGLHNDQEILQKLSTLHDLVQRMVVEKSEWEEEIRIQREEQEKRGFNKSGMEQAQQNFDSQNKVLAPSVGLREKLSAKIKGRNAGTCSWILDYDVFKRFKSSAGGSISCLVGAGGAGKSFLMAAMIEHMQKLAEEDKDVLVCYFLITKGSDATTQPTKIVRNLLSQLYAASRDSFELLDACNAQIGKYLLSQADSSKSKNRDHKGEAEEVTLVQTFADVAKLIGKRVYLFVDALDECSDGDRQDLIQTLQTLVEPVDTNINIFYSSRIKPLSERYTFIYAEENTANDIAGLVKGEMEKLPGFTPGERKTACDEITKKASWNFNYVRLAMDFMRRPWRRPLSTHLKSLPNGVDNIYTQSIEQMDPLYKDLLTTCLTWTLLTTRPLTVREIMDIYQQSHILDEDDNMDAQANEQSDLELYEKQIERAGSAFLRIEENHTIVTTHASVREYFSGPQQMSRVKSQDGEFEDCRCKRCVAVAQRERPIYIEEVSGHMQIISTILKSLLSPSFRRKYYSNKDEDSDAKDSNANEPNGFDHSKDETGDSSDEESALELQDGKIDEAVNYTAGLSAYSQSEVQAEAIEIEMNGLSSPPITSPGVHAESGQSKTEDVQELSNTATASGVEQQSQDVDSATHLQASARCEEHDVETPQLSDTTGIALVNDNDSNKTEDDSTAVIPPSPTHSGGQAMFTVNEEISQSEDEFSVADSDEELDISAEVNRDELDTGAVDSRLEVRYEIQNLLWHLIQLERIYPSHERFGTEWNDLRSLLDRFLDPESDAWKSWIKEQDSLRDVGIYSWFDGLGSIHPIHVAAFAGLTSLVKLLLERNNASDLVNLKMSSGRTPLTGAVIYNQRTSVACDELFTVLMSYGADPNGSNLNESAFLVLSPFHAYLMQPTPLAANVKLFLDHGADPSGCGSYGWAAINCFAAGGGDVAIAKLLVEAGADVKQRTREGETPMHQIVRRSDFSAQLVQYFIEKGAEIDAEDNASERPLRECTDAGHCEGLQILLDHGADIDDVDVRGRTALHVAAQRGHTKAVVLLLKRNADPSKLDDNGASPFHEACRCGNEESALLLGEALVKRERLDMLSKPTISEDKTPLMRSAATDLTKAMAQILENSKLDDQMRAISTKGRQALHFAAMKGKPSATEMLLKQGANTKIQDNKGMTPLQLCYSKIIGKPSEDRETTIMLLAEHDPCAAKAEIELLQTLIINDSPRVVRKLLELGVDPMLEDFHGWNSLQLAEQYERTEICNLILQQKRVSLRPTKFIAKPSKCYILSPDGLEIEKVQNKDLVSSYMSNDSQTMITNHPIPASDERYYFEMSIEAKDNCTIQNPIFVIGICQKTNDPLSGWHPGWSKLGMNSWGYHGDDGLFFNRSASFEPKCADQDTTYRYGDTVGCGIELKKRTVFWTRNGRRLVEAGFHNVHGQLYPAVSVKDFGKVKVNLGNDPVNNGFMWAPGNTLDFDSDVPSVKVNNDLTGEK